MRDYYKLEAGLNLVPLSEYCTEYEERFPLLVARAACMHLSKQLQPADQRESTGIAAQAPGSNTPQGDIWQVQFAQHETFLTACCLLQCIAFVNFVAFRVCTAQACSTGLQQLILHNTTAYMLCAAGHYSGQSSN